MFNRRNMLAGLFGLGGASAIARADDRSDAVFNSGLQLFFAQRDSVINFDAATGIGSHIGTVEGSITGTSMVNFQFISTSQTTIKFDNRAMITDLDGDQVIFQVLGTGRLIVPAPVDTSSPLGNLWAFGGPLVATYTALVTTGKYFFLQGRKFPCKMSASNTTLPSSGVLGSVYTEVYSDSVGVLSSLLKGTYR